jgi:hypothetical protein
MPLVIRLALVLGSGFHFVGQAMAFGEEMPLKEQRERR